MADIIKTRPKRILNNDGVISEEMYAPSIVPGIDSRPSFNPIEYSIRFCLVYDIVDATALLNAANKLLLAAKVGEYPKNVKTGTTIIPPPRPKIEPSIPATNPSGISQSCSNTGSKQSPILYCVFCQVIL